ncbi:hypothetical protein CLAIMM_13597 [Cladophialophora immunda]|nr:hypothetical protein CLAIMM_13597 [Cladophialophora immunda]
MSEWTPQFSGRADIHFSLKTENLPILDWPNTREVAEEEGDDDEEEEEEEEEEEDEGEETQSQPGEADSDQDAQEQTIIRQIHDCLQPDGCLFMVDALDGFCLGTDLASVRAAATDEARRQSAWIYDRSTNGGVPRSKPDTGRLSPALLLDRLSKPRFPSAFDNSQASSVRQTSAGATNQASIPSDQDAKPQDELDAERRSIFIPNLNPSYIYALLRTASIYQAPSLIEGMYKHLIFEPFFGWETTGPEGPCVLHMAFHLPYYVCQKSSVQQSGQRQHKDRSHLRKSQDVSFLGWNDYESSIFLYEAVISCIIIAPKDWTWTAYCFADSFFESENTTESKYQEEPLPEGSRKDPFRNGRLISDNQFHDPRVYFLEVLKVRLEEVSREWRILVEMFRAGIENYAQSHNALLESHGKISRKATQEHEENVRRAESFVLRVKSLTSKMLRMLLDTVEACETFCRDHASDFERTAALARTPALLRAEAQFLKEYRQLKRKLKSLEKSCDGFADNLKSLQQGKAIQVSNCQNELAQLSVTAMIFISPIALSVGFLSMQKEIIPFRSPNFASFVYMIMIFTVSGGLIYYSSGYLMQLYRSLNFWAQIARVASIGGGAGYNGAIEASPDVQSVESSLSGAEATSIHEDVENGGPPSVPRGGIFFRLRRATNLPCGT